MQGAFSHTFRDCPRWQTCYLTGSFKRYGVWLDYDLNVFLPAAWHAI